MMCASSTAGIPSLQRSGSSPIQASAVEQHERQHAVPERAGSTSTVVRRITPDAFSFRTRSCAAPADSPTAWPSAAYGLRRVLLQLRQQVRDL